MLVNSSSRLFTLGQLDHVRVQIVLTDKMLSLIERGQTAKVHAKNVASGSLTARLSRISPFLHPITHNTHAEIDRVDGQRVTYITANLTAGAALARAVIGGLTVSTLITLFLIPAIYSGVYDFLSRTAFSQTNPKAE